jgi:hypothetical protein
VLDKPLFNIGQRVQPKTIRRTPKYVAAEAVKKKAKEQYVEKYTEKFNSRYKD